MNKFILSCFILISLSGCKAIDAFLMARYDTNEYGLVTKIKTLADTAQCNDKDSITESAKMMWLYSVELKNFTQYIPRNTESFDMASKLTEITVGLHNKKGDMSAVYCEQKLKIITKTAEDIQKSLGGKPR